MTISYMPFTYKGREFNITKGEKYVLQVSFPIENAFELEYQGKKISSIDWMYRLAKNMNVGYPTIDRYSSGSNSKVSDSDESNCKRGISLPFNPGLACYLKSIGLRFRIFVNSDNELLSLSFEPSGKGHVNAVNKEPVNSVYKEHVNAVAGYATNIEPTAIMSESFKLFSGVDVDELVKLDVRQYTLTVYASRSSVDRRTSTIKGRIIDFEVKVE